MDINTTYVCKTGWQSVCKGVNEQGELVWASEMKQPWHLKMFPVRYGGDFVMEWMWLVLYEKGQEWREEK